MRAGDDRRVGLTVLYLAAAIILLVFVLGYVGHLH